MIQHNKTPILSVSTITAKGPRQYQEDTYFTEDLGRGRILLGVFDGHGGDDVSKMCATEAPIIMRRLLAEYPCDHSIALRKLYQELDERCNLPHVGACAAIVLVTKDKIWFSNCGDSMIACKIRNEQGKMRTLFASQDHKVMSPTEKARLNAMGSVITVTDCPRILNQLNIARSIGDWSLKPYVISNPYISTFSLKITKDKLEGFCIASDGLWDAMDAETYWNMVEMTESIHGEPQLNICLQYAYDHGSTDNITVVHCKLL
jgi:serine/threonine protein phosphatase PrpC